MLTTPFSPPLPAFDCVVVGAGIAGACTALHIQRTGASVTVVDACEPGSGASFGNAGIVVNTKLMPVFAGLTPQTFLSMLRNPASPLNVRWSRLPALTPWFLRMLSHAGPAEVERITRALASLCQPGESLYQALWDEAGIGELVQARGSIALNRSAEERDRDWEGSISLLRGMGVSMEKVGRAEIARLAPAVSGDYTHGIYSPDFQHTLDPQALVARLLDLFKSKGGKLIRGKVEHVLVEGGRVSGVRLADTTVRCESVIVAAGTGSARLADRVGDGVPHQAVGGYHIMLNEPHVSLETPILPIDFRFAITPMAAGIRLAGIYEFGGEGLRFNSKLIENMLAHVGKVLPGIRIEKRTFWRGFRSYLPDGLPIISESDRHQRLFYLFGLSSSGMINGAAAGKTMAQLWAGGTPDIDPAPFSMRRFS